MSEPESIHRITQMNTDLTPQVGDPTPDTRYPDALQRLLSESLDTASSTSLREINSQFFGMMSTGRDFRDWKSQLRQRLRWVVVPVVIGAIVAPILISSVLQSEILTKLITLPTEHGGIQEHVKALTAIPSSAPTPGAGATDPPITPNMPRFETKQNKAGGIK